MSDISLSKAVRSNLLSLQNTANMMGKTQERLATGNKVNSALDNPTNFFTASSLNSRASDLNQLMDSVGNAVQTIAAADKGIKAITKLVESAQSTARQALQTSERVVTTPATAATAGSAAVPHAPVTGSGYNIDNTVVGTFTINGSEVTTKEDMTLGELETAINLTTATSGVTASQVDGQIRLTASTSGSANANGNITIAAGTTNGLVGTGLSVGTNLGKPAVEGSDAVAEVTAANPKRAELAAQYNELLQQIDDLAKDSGFNGVNLLNGSGNDLNVTFNEDGSSNLDIDAIDLSSGGSKLSLTALDADGDDNGFSSNTKINEVLTKLKDGIDTLRTEASKFGSNLSIVENRQSFTKDMVNVLQTGAANLTLADTNEEAANLLALQTRQSLSSSALSMASQADQSVLQLLR